jgi:hypothetical protein
MSCLMQAYLRRRVCPDPMNHHGRHGSFSLDHACDLTHMETSDTILRLSARIIQPIISGGSAAFSRIYGAMQAVSQAILE